MLTARSYKERRRVGKLALRRQLSENSEAPRLATINVGTLTGRHRELADFLRRRRVDIARIQETKWKGGKSRDIEDGYKRLYDSTSSSLNGVDTAVSESLRSRIAAVDRLMGTAKAHGSRSIPMDKNDLSRSHEPCANRGRKVKTIAHRNRRASIGASSTLHHSHGCSEERSQATTSMDSPVCRRCGVVAEKRKELEEEAERWKDQLGSYGLKLNTKKTEYMEVGGQTPEKIYIDGKPIKKTSTFTYLGNCISGEGSLRDEISARTKASWMKWRTFTGVLCDKRMPVQLKSHIKYCDSSHNAVWQQMLAQYAK
ncbi:unnamed protein product [Strongylus vulgaris]|uniref:Endonuclease/exonuclease/phosphatase domain-containing protein n=1 Tax=Strongylus vulgaris TaxID=40348 RepID=A0A3P7J2E6_STRVU|nr:unnamed protein product [Strongylus vulgaris]